MGAADTIRVLCVDDDPGLADMVSTQLERRRDQFSAVGETSAGDALTNHDLADVDCVVSDYDMPAIDGLEFLERVREVDADLPFILFTGRGGEEIASEAISAGVTDYMEKRVDPDQYEVLANRVENSVERYRARREAELTSVRLEETFERVTDALFSIDEDWTISYCNTRAADYFEGTPESLRGTAPWDNLRDGARQHATERFQAALDRQEPVSFSVADPFGDGGHYEVRAFPSESGLSVYLQDVTERERREETLAALHGAATTLRECSTPEAVAEAVVETAEDLLALDHSAVVFEEDGHLSGAASSPDIDEAQLGRPVEEGVSGRTYRTGESYLITDVESDPDAEPSLPVESAVSIPIGDHGVFQAVSDEPDTFDEDDLEYAEILCSHADQALERISSAATLGEERDQLAALFEELDHPVVRTAFENGTGYVRLVNSAFEETFGVDAEAIAGEPLDDVLVDEDRRDRACELTERTAEGEAVEAEVVRSTPEGDRTFLLRSVPFELDGQQFAYGVYVDVTERERRKRELERARERYEGLLDTVPDPVLVVDPERDRIVEANPAAAELTGHPLDELEGLHQSELYPESDADRYRELFRETIVAEERRVLSEFPDGSPVEVERHDGERVPIEITGDDLEYRGGTLNLAVIRDVSERRTREELLADLQRATDDLTTAESPEGVADVAVEIAAEVLDLPATFVLQYDDDRDALVPLAHSQTAADIVADIPEVIHRGEALVWRAFDHDRTRVIDDVTETEAVYNPDTDTRAELQVPLGEHGVFLAISPERAAFDSADSSRAEALASTIAAALTSAERETRAREREAELQRQNERLERLVGAISHDLGNPLNVAKGHLSMATDGEPADHLAAVERSLDRMRELTDDLVKLAEHGRTVGSPEEVPLDETVEGAWASVSSAEATLTVDETLGTVDADPTRLRELFQNLLANAVEHAGSDVAIRVEATDDGFSVADDGPGIPPDDRDQVFEFGYTTARNGTGFGLAIVKEIAEAHGWSVSLSTAEDGGARFAFAT